MTVNQETKNLVLVLWGLSILYLCLGQLLIYHWLPGYMEKHLASETHTFLSIYVIKRCQEVRRERIQDLRDGMDVLMSQFAQH